MITRLLDKLIGNLLVIFFRLAREHSACLRSLGHRLTCCPSAVAQAQGSGYPNYSPRNLGFVRSLHRRRYELLLPHGGGFSRLQIAVDGIKVISQHPAMRYGLFFLKKKSLVLVSESSKYLE